MHIHRFYFDQPLPETLHIDDKELLHQWTRVLRLESGDELRLFNGTDAERHYRISAMSKLNATLESVEALIPKRPLRHITLFFSLLKKDKNEWVLQKCTELGVSRFVPVLTARTEKTGFVMERAAKIVIEAAEQCGRGDIPEIKDPMSLAEAIAHYQDSMTLYFCHEGEAPPAPSDKSAPIGYFVGPEGGWTEMEITNFRTAGLAPLPLGEFTLRAETACIAGAVRCICSQC